MADQPDDLLAFAPVPSHTNRRDGWTPDKQRAFIAALARCGSVSAAARQVGRSTRGAYALLDRPGAESFTAAWDQAIVIGTEATRDCVIDRALHGAWVPVMRRGRTVRMEYRYFDRLAVALLSGRDNDIEARRLVARQGREHRLAVRREEEARAAREADYRRQIDAATARHEAAKREAAPRVRPL